MEQSVLPFFYNEFFFYRCTGSSGKNTPVQKIHTSDVSRSKSQIGQEKINNVSASKSALRQVDFDISSAKSPMQENETDVFNSNSSHQEMEGKQSSRHSGSDSGRGTSIFSIKSRNNTETNDNVESVSNTYIPQCFETDLEKVNVESNSRLSGENHDENINRSESPKKNPDLQPNVIIENVISPYYNESGFTPHQVSILDISCDKLTRKSTRSSSSRNTSDSNRVTKVEDTDNNNIFTAVTDVETDDSPKLANVGISPIPSESPIISTSRKSRSAIKSDKLVNSVFEQEISDDLNNVEIREFPFIEPALPKKVALSVPPVPAKRITRSKMKPEVPLKPEVPSSEDSDVETKNVVAPPRRMTRSKVRNIQTDVQKIPEVPNTEMNKKNKTPEADSAIEKPGKFSNRGFSKQTSVKQLAAAYSSHFSPKTGYLFIIFYMYIIFIFLLGGTYKHNVLLFI